MTKPSNRYHLQKTAQVNPILEQLMQKADIRVSATVPNINWEDAHKLRVNLSGYVVHVAEMMASQVNDLQTTLRPFVHPERWNELAIVTKALRSDIENASNTVKAISTVLWDCPTTYHSFEILRFQLQFHTLLREMAGSPQLMCIHNVKHDWFSDSAVPHNTRHIALHDIVFRTS